AIPSDELRCQHTAADGKRCRGLRLDDYHLCATCDLRDYRAKTKHLPQLNAPDLAAIADRILPTDQSLDSARNINAALTRLFRFVAAGQLTTRHGAILGYIVQLSICTLPGLAREIKEQPKHPLLGADPAAVFDQIASSLQEFLPAAMADHAQAPPATEALQKS
ncbi:MAG: hypothetical protein ACRD5W_01665, partial [Candidatus Acidiferrales bacterium]